MSKKSKSKKKGHPKGSSAKKNGIFAPKKSSEHGFPQQHKSVKQGSNRTASQNSRKT